MIWDCAAVSWDSGSVAGTLIKVAIAACIGSNDFSVFTQDTAISWDVIQFSSAIFFITNGGTGA